MVCEPCFPARLHGPAGSGKARIGLGLSRDPAQSPHWGFWELWSGQRLARKADETGQQRSVAGQPGAPCRHCPLAFMTPQEGAPPEAGGPGAPVVACGCPSSDVLWGWPPPSGCRCGICGPCWRSGMAASAPPGAAELTPPRLWSGDGRSDAALAWALGSLVCRLRGLASRHLDSGCLWGRPRGETVVLPLVEPRCSLWSPRKLSWWVRRLPASRPDTGTPQQARDGVQESQVPLARVALSTHNLPFSLYSLEVQARVP